MAKGETHAWRFEGVSKLEPVKDLSDSETENVTVAVAVN